jgi:hypothetical protein
MTIDYDASSLQGWVGLPRLLLSWRGTIWQGSLTGPVFWLTQLSHVAILILTGALPILVPDPLDGTGGAKVPYFSCNPASGAMACISLPSVAWSSASIALGLLFFFLVFYSNNCFTRFFTLYGHCVGLGASTMEWVHLVKHYSRRLTSHEDGPPAVRRIQWNCTRLVLAAMHVLYYSLHGSSAGEAIAESEWRMMLARDLLSADEVATLRAYKGFKPFLALSWAVEEAAGLLEEAARCDRSRHHDLGQGTRDEIVLAQFREAAFKFRGHCGQIVNLLKQPVPFPYFHLLNVILVAQLLLLSYALATSGSLHPSLSIIVLVFISVVILGMRGLAVQLSSALHLS